MFLMKSIFAKTLQLMETAGQWFESNTASRTPSSASRTFSELDGVRGNRAATPVRAGNNITPIRLMGDGFCVVYEKPVRDVL
jgi:hypothetical protein